MRPLTYVLPHGVAGSGSRLLVAACRLLRQRGFTGAEVSSMLVHAGAVIAGPACSRAEFVERAAQSYDVRNVDSQALAPLGRAESSEARSERQLERPS